MSLGSLTIQEFLDRLASSDPTPGGGALAALAGAMAGGMVSMLCHLTLGRPRFAAVEGELQDILAQATGYRQRLAQLADADAEAYGAVLSAYRLPRSTEEQQQVRAQAIEESLHRATEVPVESAEVARAVLALAAQAAPVGNPSALADVAVAAHLAAAAARGAAHEARYNIGALRDIAFAAAMQERLDAALADLEDLIGATVGTIESRGLAP